MASGGLFGLFRKDSSTEAEIKQLVNEDESELESSQREIIKNVFDFDDTTAGDIMTHRTDICAVEDCDGLMSVVKCAIDEGYSRIPVFHEDLDHINGIVYVKDLLCFVGKAIDDDESLDAYIRKPLFVPETIPCAKLFARMQSEQKQLAIVVDEYGGTAGLVTLEDVVEELVGDIEDEYDDHEEDFLVLGDGSFAFDGGTDIEDFEMSMDVKLPDGDYDTLAGFVISLLGFVPDDNTENAVAEYNNIRFTVLDVDERRIEKIKVEIDGGTDNNS